MAGGDLCAISHVDPNFEVMLALLFQVVALEVVDDGEVVDVAAARGNVPVLVASIFLAELTDELLCRNEIQMNYMLVMKSECCYTYKIAMWVACCT